jgi:hypothetical protein
MNINISDVTREEFELVRPHFEVNANALANQTHFVGDEGELIKKKSKEWHWTGYDQSKYLKAIIEGETFIIAAGNVITGVISEVLPQACQQYAENFGTRDAHAVVKAIFDTRPQPGFPDMSSFEQFLSTEQFAFVFKVESDGTVNRHVLRLDLFRMIQVNKDDPGQNDFTGGLMHALKHFRYNGCSLSTHMGENELHYPTDIIGMVIRCFFESPHIYTNGQKKFRTETPWPQNKTIICGFYPEQEIEVYFLSTMYIR